MWCYHMLRKNGPVFSLSFSFLCLSLCMSLSVYAYFLSSAFVCIAVDSCHCRCVCMLSCDKCWKTFRWKFQNEMRIVCMHVNCNKISYRQKVKYWWRLIWQSVSWDNISSKASHENEKICCCFESELWSRIIEFINVL